MLHIALDRETLFLHYVYSRGIYSSMTRINMMNFEQKHILFHSAFQEMGMVDLQAWQFALQWSN